eukprot:382727-Pelagomonas_calceolata.AAC.1
MHTHKYTSTHTYIHTYTHALAIVPSFNHHTNLEKNNCLQRAALSSTAAGLVGAGLLAGAGAAGAAALGLANSANPQSLISSGMQKFRCAGWAACCSCSYSVRCARTVGQERLLEVLSQEWFTCDCPACGVQKQATHKQERIAPQAALVSRENALMTLCPVENLQWKSPPTVSIFHGLPLPLIYRGRCWIPCVHILPHLTLLFWSYVALRAGSKMLMARAGHDAWKKVHNKRATQLAVEFRDFDTVWDQAPRLRPFLWQRGLALYYQSRFVEGAEQFRSSFISLVAFNDTLTRAMVWVLTAAKQVTASTVEVPAPRWVGMALGHGKDKDVGIGV